MTNSFGSRPTVHADAPVFVISVAAELAGMHPQTLRAYDRLGLVTAARTAGGGRRYSLRQVELLRTVQHMSQNEGINLAGIQRILDLSLQVSELQAQVRELAAQAAELSVEVERREAAVHASYRRDLVPVRRATEELVRWQLMQTRPTTRS